MNAILNVPDKAISFELDNVSISQFKRIINNPIELNMDVFHRQPSGEIITIVTSNLPQELNNEIENLIKLYCNH